MDHNLNKSSAFELLSNFITSCAFIHDDWNPLLEHSDWDHYDTNPFLLGADHCVVNTLNGFGEDYLEYLDRLGCLPKNIFIPKNTDTILVNKLLADEVVLQQFVDVVQREKLDISCFYSDEARNHEDLLHRLNQSDHQTQLYPRMIDFLIANDKVRARILLEEKKIPIPKGLVCNSRFELEQYVKRQRTIKQFDQVLLKQSHRNNTLLDINSNDVNYGDFSYPLIAEGVYVAKCSPICHIIVFGGCIEVLFILDQIIDKYHHVGNEYPLLNVSPQLKAEIEKISQEIASLFPNFIGVMGIDFIVTSDDQLYVVDVNPRFCSSTYPLFFLERLNCIDGRYFIKTLVVNQEVDNLQVVASELGELIFRPNCGGIFLYNPTYDFNSNRVSHFSCLITGKDLNEVSKLQNQLYVHMEKLKQHDA